MTTFRYEDDSDKRLPQDERYWRAEAVSLASEMLVAIVTGGGTYKQTPAELIAQVFAVADEFMAEVRRRKEKA